MRFILVILFVAFSNFTFAGKIKKGFEALCIYDFFKAKKIFYKSLNQKNPASCFGLAIIYSKNNNPFYNLDSATKYINRAVVYFKTKNTPQHFNCTNVDSLSINNLLDSINTQLYLLAIKKNKVNDFENFLCNNYLAKQAQISNILLLRDELEFTATQKENKSKATYYFIVTHPLSKLKNKATTLFQNQLYSESVNSNTLESYYTFIKNYPNNNNLQNAYQTLFEKIKKINDTLETNKFIETCKNAPQINEAWKLLFTQCVKIYNNTNLKSFITRYPNFPYKSEILEELELNTKVYLPFKQNDYFGYIDTTSKIVIEPIYDNATDFNEGLAVVNKNDSVFFIDKNNKNKFNRVFDDAYSFKNGYTVVKEKNKFYFINRLGQKVSDLFNDVNEVSNDLYVAKKDSLYGALNLFGKTQIDFQFQKLGDFINGYAYFINNNKYGIITKQGETLISNLNWVSNINEDSVFIIKNNHFYGIINQFGHTLLEAKYDLITYIKNGFYIIVKNDKYGFYNAHNKCFNTEIAFDFLKEKETDYYSNGKGFKLIKNNTQAIIDVNGKIGIDFGIYDEIYFAENNLIKVKRKQKYGFVDRKLNLVIPYKYEKANDFKDSTTVVSYKNKNCIIDLSGKELYCSDFLIKKINNEHYFIESNPLEILSNKGVDLYNNIESIQKVNNFLLILFKNNTLKLLPIKTNGNFDY
ncbi:MAG: WG repeat-containing protein [Bacteroidetes bacterium]|nr:WG repeat-containing protein [Bacteroidota bacterium]